MRLRPNEYVLFHKRTRFLMQWNDSGVMLFGSADLPLIRSRSFRVSTRYDSLPLILPEDYPAVANSRAGLVTWRWP